MDLTGKKVLIVGAGISGFAAAKISRRLGAQVTLSDAKDEADLDDDFDELRDMGVNLVFGPQSAELLDGVSLVIVSPAVPARIPLIQEAYKRKIRVASEVELAYRLKKAPICAVTGTNGKTTTVTLLGLLLESHFDKVGVGGNIGIPLSEVALEIPADGCIAAEISSYQMEVTSEFHPHVATILNVTPDHIVRHGSMDEYQRMKERLFAQQKGKDFLVLNYDDERVKDMANRASAHVVFFSRQVHLHEGAYLEEDMLTLAWAGQTYPLCTISELGIKGSHNVENALAAVMTAFLAGCKAEEMVPVLKSFRGVEHRIEYVRTLNGVEYYNDSKATNTDSAIKALETFQDGIVLIAGGDDKLTDLTDFLMRVKERVSDLILIGAAADRFEQEAIKQGYPQEHIHRAGYSMERAVELAHNLAKSPQVVLLSPACASFDMYNGMAERGCNFKDLVNKL